MAIETDEDKDKPRVILEDGRELSADLVIGADGNSFLLYITQFIFIYCAVLVPTC